MPKTNKTARLLVRYGKHAAGEEIRGDLATKLINEKMAVDITPKAKTPKAGKSKSTKKDAGAAPENKGDGFEV